MSNSQAIDVIIIGAGMVGLATAWRLSQKYPRKSILVLEKEPQVARHQTGHNSGVIHSGIYYKPGSLKAVNCRAGKRAMEAFCQEQGIPFEICGKVIVATTPAEQERLPALLERGKANGVDCELISRSRLAELEPHCAGLQAIFVRETGIVNYPEVCERLKSLLEQAGHEVRLGVRVTGLKETATEIVIHSLSDEFKGRHLINCAGLYSDKIARLSGREPGVRIVPFRGEYYEINPAATHLCRNLIYPVPDPRFPFLGVHFTRMIHGGVECGPNAVFAFAREGYRKSDIHWGELMEILAYPGFIRMSAKYWKTGFGEMWRSLYKPAFVKALQRLIPAIRAEHLAPAAAGVRAQAIARDGRLLDDFAFCETARMVHVLNAPSPAATASLSIADSVVEKAAKRFY